MSSPRSCPNDANWADDRPSAQRWRAEWAERARHWPVAARQGFVVTPAQCYQLGLTRAQLRSRVRRRIWWTPRAGVLSVLHPGDDADLTVALRATAAALTHRGSVISHESAAVLHGLPVLNRPLMPILTIDHARRGQRSGVHLRTAPINDPPAWWGAPVTSVERTIIDIARGDRDAGLVIADAALRENLTTRPELAAALGTCAGWPGAAAARWVVARADPGSESVLESLVRACLLVGGLPAPELQVRIPNAQARVDMLYRDQLVVIEADGMLKYTDPSRLREEKRRQERLEQTGLRVVRVTWADVVGRPDETVSRVRSALH